VGGVGDRKNVFAKGGKEEIHLVITRGSGFKGGSKKKEGGWVQLGGGGDGGRKKVGRKGGQNRKLRSRWGKTQICVGTSRGRKGNLGGKSRKDEGTVERLFGGIVLKSKKKFIPYKSVPRVGEGKR